MIIMPTFPHREECQQRVIPTIVSRYIDSQPPDMSKRINEEGEVEYKDRANKATPDKSLEANSKAKGKSKAKKDPNTHQDKRNHPVFVKPEKFRKRREVLDPICWCIPVLVSKKPAHMGPPKSVLFGRVDVLRLV